MRAKLAHEYLTRKAEVTGDGDQVLLPPAAGGFPLAVKVGMPAGTTTVAADATKSLSHQEAITVGYQNNLSSTQLENIMADLRAEHGRDFVEPGLHKAKGVYF